LQGADAYGGDNATEAACMAHARPKIHDVHVRMTMDITTEALERIGKRYAAEAKICGSPADERLMDGA